MDRKPSYRSLVVVDTKTREIFAVRRDDTSIMGSGNRITKPIYDLVKSGNGIMYYAHAPQILRIPVEINGRFFAKAPGWVYKDKIPNPRIISLDAASPTNIIRIYNVTGFRDGTDYVEYDGTNFTSVLKNGTKVPVIGWSISFVQLIIDRGTYTLA